jgi:hypothetical protein
MQKTVQGLLAPSLEIVSSDSGGFVRHAAQVLELLHIDEALLAPVTAPRVANLQREGELYEQIHERRRESQQGYEKKETITYDPVRLGAEDVGLDGVAGNLQLNE